MKTTQQYQDYKKLLFSELDKLRLPNGFHYASPSVDYNASWLRDNCFINMCYLEENPEQYVKSVQAMLDILKKFEKKYHKLSAFVNNPEDRSTYRFLHAKFNPITEDEIEGIGDKWNHNQSETLGLILLNITMGLDRGLPIIRDYSDRGIIQLFIDYSVAVGYKANCSSWEEENEVRLSSTALMLKGFREARSNGFFVPQYILDEGDRVYDSLFPFEHMNKKVDLMLLYLPFFNICDNIETKYIVKSVESTLLRDKGVCRYLKDHYYQEDGVDAPWSFGLSFLSCIYSDLNHDEIARMYCDKLMDLYVDGRIPELLIRGEEANVNTPLAWSLSMEILAINKILGKIDE